MNIVNQPVILKCNAHWMPIAFSTPARTFSDMAAGAVTGLSVTYEKGENGEWDFDNPIETIPVSWEDWLDLEIREYDMVLHTVNRVVRIPPVVIAVNFSKIPSIKPRLTRNAILERDGYQCAYTGDKFDPKDAKKHLNIDHVVPRSKGGATSWHNVVAARKDINAKKADKSPEEAGLTLLRKPTEPKPRPQALSELLSSTREVNPGWRWILPKNSQAILT